MTLSTPAPELLTQTAGGRTLLFTFAAGQQVPAHSHPQAKVTLAVLQGQIEITTDTVRVLGVGEVLVHEGGGTVALLARTAGRVLVCLVNQVSA